MTVAADSVKGSGSGGQSVAAGLAGEDVEEGVAPPVAGLVGVVEPLAGGAGVDEPPPSGDGDADVEAAVAVAVAVERLSVL